MSSLIKQSYVKQSYVDKGRNAVPISLETFTISLETLIFTTNHRNQKVGEVQYLLVQPL